MIATAPKIVFCFAGQGYVPLEAAQDLYRTCDVFKDAIDEVDSNIASSTEQKLVEQTFIPLKEYLMEAEIRSAHVPPFQSDENGEAEASSRPHQRLWSYSRPNMLWHGLYSPMAWSRPMWWVTRSENIVRPP